MYVKSVETAKVIPTRADISNMAYYSTMEVASRIGISPRRVRAIAIDHAIGRIIGHSRIFTEAEIEEVRWYTRRGRRGVGVQRG